MAEYRLSPAAERDLESIWLYSQAQLGLEQAHHYIDILSAMFETLAHSPKTAEACDDFAPGIAARAYCSMSSIFASPATESPSCVFCMDEWMHRAIYKQTYLFTSAIAA